MPPVDSPIALLAPTLSDFEPRFLTVGQSEAYFRFLEEKTGPSPPAFRLLEPRDLSRKPYPLELCEFLAYKSVLAYADEEKIKENLETGCRGYEKDTFKFFDSSKTAGDTQGYGFVIDDTAFIVMRGTTSFKDWIDNVTTTWTDAVEVPEATRTAVGGAFPRRHLGFARAWANVVHQIDAWLDGLPKSSGGRVRQCCFSGHSLGGALALIGAHDFARREKLPVAAVVTFAAPIVGEEEFSKDYNETLDLERRTLRLESTEDAVPRLTLSLLARSSQSPGATFLIDKRPMIGGWEKLGAALLGIAGWKKGTSAPAETKPAASGEGAEKLESTTTEPTKPQTAAEESAKPADSGSKPAQEISWGTAIVWIVGVVAIVIVYMVARKLVIRYRAHGVAKRYALYLTTLSYQHIRQLYAVRPESLDPATGNLRPEIFDKAYEALARHLEHVRGPDADVFKGLRKRPIRITAKNFEKFVAESEEAYKAYVW